MGHKKATLGSKKNNKFTLKQFSWNGFNMTVGIPFLGSLALLANSESNPEHPGQGLGFHILWIFLVMGIIASACAFAFAKLSRNHKQDNNGGAYIFARSAFGRFVGFVVLFLNYIIMPLVLSNQILMFVKANFNPEMAGATDWWNNWTLNLGNWANLTYDFIGVALSMVFILVAFLGTRVFKKVTKYSLLIKWVSSGFLVLFGVVAACIPTSASGYSNNAIYWANNSHISVSTFLSAFCACFYYFTGFEAFASSGATVKDAEKNIGKGIMIVMFASTAFYIIISALFMMAQWNFSQNINTGFWVYIENLSPYLHWLIYAGPIIMIVSTVFNRGPTVSMAVLYGGTTLQPMSIEGYISDNFAKMDENGFPVAAMKLHIIICLFTIGMWAFIPDLVVGIVGPNADFINVNTIISAASIFYILIYIVILLAILKFSFKGMIKTSSIESALYIISFLSLIIVVIYHFYLLFDNAIDSSQWGGWVDKDKTIWNPTLHKNENIVALGIEIGFLVACGLFIWIVYFHYYRKKYDQRVAKNPSAQLKLNYEFRVLDGWSYLKAKTIITTTDFINQREKFIKANGENLYTSNFLSSYTSMSEQFIMNVRHDLAQHIARSARVEEYNMENGNDAKHEINIHNKDANNFMVSLQRKIRVGPSYKI